MSDWFQPTVVESDHLEIRPFVKEDIPRWLEWANPEDFTYFPTYPTEFTQAAFEAYAEVRAIQGVHLVSALARDGSGSLAAISSFMDVRPAHRALEIGHTIIAPHERGGWVNPALKLAMLAHAFDRLGAVRVQLKSDANNARSRAAMAKLGAQFEGVQRAVMILPDGRLRNTSFYSILPDEWPAVRKGLEDRLRLLLNNPSP